jgi:hypothetical protein
MRKLGSWGTAALIVGLGMTVARAEEPQGDSRPTAARNSWWSGWFGDKPAAKPKDRGKEEKASPSEDKPAPPNPSESAAVEQKRQMNAYLRRVEVCLRLRQIAEDTGNAELQRQAEEMDARAWEIYRQQTARLPISDTAADRESMTLSKKPVRKMRSAETASSEKGSENATPALNRPSRSARSGPLGGDFEQREQSLLNGTFMGRDKP